MLMCAVLASQMAVGLMAKSATVVGAAWMAGFAPIHVAGEPTLLCVVGRPADVRAVGSLPVSAPKMKRHLARWFTLVPIDGGQIAVSRKLLATQIEGPGVLLEGLGPDPRPLSDLEPQIRKRMVDAIGGLTGAGMLPRDWSSRQGAKISLTTLGVAECQVNGQPREVILASHDSRKPASAVDAQDEGDGQGEALWTLRFSHPPSIEERQRVGRLAVDAVAQLVRESQGLDKARLARGLKESWEDNDAFWGLLQGNQKAELRELGGALRSALQGRLGLGSTPLDLTLTLKSRLLSVRIQIPMGGRPNSFTIPLTAERPQP